MRSFFSLLRQFLPCLFLFVLVFFFVHFPCLGCFLDFFLFVVIFLSFVILLIPFSLFSLLLFFFCFRIHFFLAIFPFFYLFKCPFLRFIYFLYFSFFLFLLVRLLVSSQHKRLSFFLLSVPFISLSSLLFFFII